MGYFSLQCAVSQIIVVAVTSQHEMHVFATENIKISLGAAFYVLPLVRQLLLTVPHRMSKLCLLRCVSVKGTLAL